jgi:TrmH family RNA methyltransferase
MRYLRGELTVPFQSSNHIHMVNPFRITSRQNPRVQAAVRLRKGQERVRQGRFIVEGAREIQRAIESRIDVLEAFVCEEMCDATRDQDVINAIRSTPAEVFSVNASVYAKLAFGDRDDGLVVVAKIPQRRLQDLTLPLRPIIAVLEGVEKPGNVGAILRSADAAGVNAVIIADGRTDLYNPNTIRASLGTVFRENVCEATAAETLAWLRGQNVPIVAARPDAQLRYTEAYLHGGAAIVLGSEAAGLGDAWSGPDVTPVRLPMHGLADSLNVSTTAAVLFYEALRQRGD